MTTSEIAGGDPVTANKINEITVGTTAPTSPTEGDVWIDTAVSGSPALKAYTGTAWEEKGGGGMDWAVRLTGDPIFPFNGNVATDVTIAAPTTWDEGDYPGRIVQLDRLDVDDVLTLQGGPWFVFCDVLDFGASGDINSDGPDGEDPPVSIDIDWNIGGRAEDGAADAQAGSGGGLIIIVAREITGSVRTISANGGAGARDTNNAGTQTQRGGQGAFSDLNSTVITSSVVSQGWSGNNSAAANGVTRMELAQFLASSASFVGASGGGSGGRITGIAGSGIGAGGDSASNQDGELPRIFEPSPEAIVRLALAGCTGGGGGGAIVQTAGANNGAGGGGAGAVLVFVQTLTTTPTLAAIGGIGVTPSGTNDGSAGFTKIVDVP